MAKPSEIPALLPGLLSCIRMIWNLSKFYNTEERLTGLLRKISNEVNCDASKITLRLRRCCVHNFESCRSYRRTDHTSSVRLELNDVLIQSRLAVRPMGLRATTSHEMNCDAAEMCLYS